MPSVASERLENVRMIRESAAAVADESDLGRVRRQRFTAAGFDRAVWTTMGEMGWLGLRLPESLGGSDLGMTEYCTLARALGRALTPEPLIEGVLAARLIDGDLLAEFLGAQTIIMPAWPGETTPTLDGGRLNGEARFAPMAGGADGFVVPLPGGAAFVGRTAGGLTVKVEKTQDGGNLGELHFENTPATFFPGDLQRPYEEAALATAAYLLGVMERAFEITLEYMRTRQQFGKPIGSFQSLQHKAADLRLQIALSDASVNAASEAWDDMAPAADVSGAVARAKVRATEAAMRVTREVIQLHGAIGYTDEADISLFVRKAMTLANRYGSPAEHRARRIAELLATGDRS